MFARTGSQANGAECKVPVIRHIVEFSCTSTMSVSAGCAQTGQQYSATEQQRANAEDHKVFAFAPQLEPANFISRSLRLFNLLATFVSCCL